MLQKKLLLQAISQDKEIANTLKGLNLKDVAFMLAEAWDATPGHLIMTSWNKLWPSRTRENDQDQSDTWDPEDDIPLARIKQMLTESDMVLDYDYVNEWLQEDGENVFMDEQDIVDNVQNENEDEDDAPSDAPSVFTPSVKLDKALASFNTCVQWAEENNISAEDIMTLRKLRENVFKKNFTARKQNLITSYFKKVD